MHRAFAIIGLFALALLLPEFATMQAPPPLPPCPVDLPGCGGPANVIADLVLPNTLLFMLRIATGLAVLACMLSGVRLMIAVGDEGSLSAARRWFMFSLAGLFLALMSQNIVSFVVTEDFGQSAVGDFVVGGLFRSAARIIVTLSNIILGLVVVFIGGRMVISSGKADEFNRLRQALLWAILGGIILNGSAVAVRVVLTFLS